MATVIDFRSRRITRDEPARKFVVCEQCGERHPIVRMADGSYHCPTAFEDIRRWFCRNRGCRAAWLTQTPTNR
ncbi:MAG: hypothetical protein HY270_04150 [Deltaproteobacteria bacterium]|nr:hypothetical protein [Deltaproteobacteria bacterium]